MTEEFTEETPQESHADWALRIKRERMRCNRAQAIIALRHAGILPAVEAHMSNPETDPTVVDAWHNSPQFVRTAPLVVGMAAALELADEQLDGLFEAAMQVEA